VSDKNILLQDKNLQKDVERVCNWIRSKKAFWVVWIDFLTYIDNEGRKKSVFIEINGRYNGSTHGAVIAKKLWKKHWASHDGISVKSKSFHNFVDTLDSEKLLYSKEKNTGVIPVNPSHILEGKWAVVIVADTKLQTENILQILHNSHY
jgi:hypothetical protein